LEGESSKRAEEMFLRCTRRKKDGKEHRYWSVVENRRVADRGVVQKQFLYLGEINDSQQAAWQKTIEVFDETQEEHRQMYLFPHDRKPSTCGGESVKVRLDQLSLHRPRQWGGCWLVLELWNQLDLNSFWIERLPKSRKGTDWLHVLQTLTCYCLCDPGSEWRLHREWYDRSALGDLLNEDFRIAAIQTLYRCLDHLVSHKDDLFQFLQHRWGELFGAEYDILLYDLTSTYFECDPPEGESLKKFGYSRDKRSDCVQVVIALVLTADGLPVAYETLAGNTKDDQTLEAFLERIERRYGKAKRIWLMDRGIPTEAALEKMRADGIFYIVGAKRGKLTALEKSFLQLSWSKVQGSVEVKLLKKDNERYVLTRSPSRVAKERAMRKRRLKRLWKRLHELRAMKKLSRDDFLVKLGEAKKDARQKVFALVTLTLPGKEQEMVTPENFTFSLNKAKLRTIRRREGHYLFRSNVQGKSAETLWEWYLQLVEIENTFRTLKGDLSIRPVFHQNDSRIEAHIFVAFLAYCLHTTLKQRLKPHAPGLTPRAVLEKFSAMQMVDVHLPTDDGHLLILSRYTQPEKEQKMLLNILNLKLPAQPPPKITSNLIHQQNGNKINVSKTGKSMDGPCALT
jgi:transposase